MGCTLRPRLNNLSSIWYTVIITLLQAYLLFLGFERYRLYTDIKWPTGGYPQIWFTVYIVIYISCIPATLLFFACGFFKSGNIAGDNERLADREERVLEVSRNRNGEKSGCCHRLKIIWQHLPPLPQQIHVIMAIAQLIAQQLMYAQVFRNNFLHEGDFLNTELDFLYQRSRQLASNLPYSGTQLQGFQITSEQLSGIPVSPSILPVLMHFKLFGVPLEFVNLLIALIAFSITFPAVFWRVSKSFSMIFTIHLLIYSAQVIWGYLSFSILYRVQETNIHSSRPVGIGQYLGPIKPLGFQIYHPLVILGTFLVRLLITTLAPTAMYSYGYNKLYVNMLNVQQRNAARNSQGQGEYGEYRRRSYSRLDGSKLCCDGYLPHMNAIALLVIVAGAIGPTIYALLILYQHDQKPILLTCIIIDVIYMFSWILMWLGMTLKRDWDFNVTHKVHQLYALQKGMATGAIRGNENPSQLKNSILVVHRDTMYVTDDQNAKQSLLRSIHTGKFDNGQDEVYWKNNSPIARSKLLAEMDGVKNSPEMARLIQSQGEDTISYHSNARQGQLINRGNSSPPQINQFGTIQRNQQQQQQSQQYAGTLQRGQSGGTLQRGPGADTVWNQYASIQKEKQQQMLQRRDSGEHYGRIGDQPYGSYARIPQVSRIQVTPQGGQIRLNGYGGLQQSTLQRQDFGSQPSAAGQSINSIRQSPLLSERSSVVNVPPPQPVIGREQSPYQRSAVKLSSFAESNKGSGGIYGTTGISSSTQSVQWGGTAQRVAPGQPGQLLWNNTNGQSSQNKSSLTSTTTSSQNDEQCFTPTSTLTSHGSNYTPTPGSPQGSNPLYSRLNGASTSSNLYGAISSATKDVSTNYSDRTLQKNTSVKPETPSTTTVVSSFTLRPNGCAANNSINQNDFATSIV
ncbi:unnamed protein product [Caenorhabditis angaria]|uniref:Protein tincar n=1 Tax=Caenorhabditis angaria TaxID=860376 RepID=A0A9P1J5I3_9PELO|nr:unnamed protein product [Caenorhabditis angaria]